MRRLLKMLVYAVGLLALLLVVLLALIFSVDPNSLKPTLQQQAAKQGLYLDFRGDLSWQIYPSLGIGVAGLKLYDNADKSGETLADIDAASLSVDWRPLLSRRIEVSGVSVQGATIRYRILPDGSSNWDVLSATEASTAPSSAAPSNRGAGAAAKGAPQLQIHSLILRAVNLEYDDQVAQTSVALRDLSLSVGDFNLQGRPSDWSIDGRLNVRAYPGLHLRLHHSLALDLEQESWRLEKGSLAIEGEQQESLRGEYSGSGSWRTQASELKLSFASDSLRRWMAAFGIDVKDFPAGTMQAFKLASSLSVNSERVQVSGLSLSLDDTSMTGELSLVPASENHPLAVDAKLHADHLDLDRYLPATSAGNSGSAATSADQELPFDALRGIKANAQISLDRLRYRGLDIGAISITAQDDDGLLRIPAVAASIGQGKVSGAGNLDARKRSPLADARLDAVNIDVGELLKKFADFSQIQGLASGSVNLKSRGNTAQQLRENVVAGATIQSQQLQLTPINLVKTFCEAVNLLDGKQSPQREWSKLTRFAPLSVDIELKNEDLALRTLDASIEKLQAKASGNLNIGSGTFDVPVSLQLANFASGVEGCTVISDKWRKQILPLRCKGLLAKLGVDTCKPDMEILRAKLKDNAKREVEKKKDKVEQKAGREVEKYLDKKLNKDDKEKLKDLLKGLKK